MKTLMYFFAFAMLLVAGCAKDEAIDESSDLKKAKVPIPIKAEFCAIPDFTVPPVSVEIPGQGILNLPGGMYVTGTCSHMGKVNREKSYNKVDTREFVMDEGKPFLYETGTGVMTAANGDNYQITWWVKTSLITWDFIGGVEMFDGTGKFKGMTGTVDMVGSVDMANQNTCWTGIGTMVYK